MKHRRDPFTLFKLDDAIIRRESERWVASALPRLVETADLGSAPLTTQHLRIIVTAYISGAEFELIRLSRATAVNFHGLPKAHIERASKLWGANVKRSKVNACSLDDWRNVLRNSFSMGAEFVRHYLFPNAP